MVTWLSQALILLVLLVPLLLLLLLLVPLLVLRLLRRRVLTNQPAVPQARNDLEATCS